MSPPIDLSVAQGVPTLASWCNNQFEEKLCDDHESVTIWVFGDADLKLKNCLTCATCYQNVAPISHCDYDAWHEHKIQLDKSWGVATLWFVADGDGVANDGAGYFVDDLSVVDVLVTTTYCTAKVNSQDLDGSRQPPSTEHVDRVEGGRSRGAGWPEPFERASLTRAKSPAPAIDSCDRSANPRSAAVATPKPRSRWAPGA